MIFFNRYITAKIIRFSIVICLLVFNILLPLSQGKGTLMNESDDIYPTSAYPRISAIDKIRIWFSNTTIDSSEAVKWFPSNATEYDNHSTNVQLKEQLMADIFQIQEEDNFHAFIFNQSTSLIWSYSECYFSLAPEKYGPLYDIRGEPYLNITQEFESLQFSNNCVLYMKNNETTYNNYYLAMEEGNYSLAETFIPGTDPSLYEKHAYSRIPTLYANNITIQRLASCLETFSYIDHVDVFYNFDFSWQMLGVTDRTPLDVFLQEWGILVALIVVLTAGTLMFAKKIRKIL
jgi:hypothetical protein